MAEDLTADERAELDELRATRDNQVAPEDAPESTLPDTHWVHLANGDVFTAKGNATHVGGVPVIGVYAIPEELQEGAEERNKVQAHQF